MMACNFMFDDDLKLSYVCVPCFILVWSALYQQNTLFRLRLDILVFVGAVSQRIPRAGELLLPAS